MPILNYTTKVPVDRTVNEIHKILAKAGASAILSEYDASGQLSHVSFRVNHKHGPISFRLPANIDGVSDALRSDSVYRDDAHARRVAWRILKDWIEAQMAIIEAQMAELTQVFLPYAQTPTGETVYERLIDGGLKMLTGPKE